MKLYEVYGIVGLIVCMVFTLNLFFFRIQPFLIWYFIPTWFGLILFIDSLVYKIKKSSLIINHFKKFIGMLSLSAIIWWTFEFFNMYIQNWSYHNIPEPQWLVFSVSFSTVLPAVMEFFELFDSLHIFEKIRLKKMKISRKIVNMIFLTGVLTLLLPIIIPTYFFWTVWLIFFLLLDPLNYLNKQPSVIGYLEKGRVYVILSLFLAGIVAGFFWEFWNYRAVPKWTYHIPFISGYFPQLFEMPLPGYLGYLPFALELFSIYIFAQSFFVERKK